MADTFSSLLRLRLQETGSNANAWGTLANDGVFELLEDAVAGQVSIAVSAAQASTLTQADGSTDQSRMAALVLSGTTATGAYVVVPSLSKHYFVRNNANVAVSVRTAGIAGPNIPADGRWYSIFVDGVSVGETATTYAAFAVSASSALTANTATSATNNLALVGGTLTGYLGIQTSLSNPFSVGSSATAAQSIKRLIPVSGSAYMYYDEAWSFTDAAGAEYQGVVMRGVQTVATSSGRSAVLQINTITNNGALALQFQAGNGIIGQVGLTEQGVGTINTAAYYVSNGRVGDTMTIQNRQPSGTAGPTYAAATPTTVTFNTAAVLVGSSLTTLVNSNFPLQQGRYSLDFDVPARWTSVNLSVTGRLTLMAGSTTVVSGPHTNSYDTGQAGGLLLRLGTAVSVSTSTNYHLLAYFSGAMNGAVPPLSIGPEVYANGVVSRLA